MRKVRIYSPGILTGFIYVRLSGRMIFSTYGTSLYPDTSTLFSLIFSPLRPHLCNYLWFLSPFTSGKTVLRTNTREKSFFLFDPVAKLPINMNLLLTKKWKGTSLQNEHPLPSPYFLEKNASLFLSFHRVHASFSLLFFLLHFPVTSASSYSFTFLPPRRLFFEPDVPVLYDSFSIPLSSSTLHRSPFENFGPTPGVPPLSLAPFPPPTHPSLPPTFRDATE